MPRHRKPASSPQRQRGATPPRSQVGSRTGGTPPVAGPPRASPIAPTRRETAVPAQGARPAGKGTTPPAPPVTKVFDVFVRDEYYPVELLARGRDVPGTLVRIRGCGVRELPEAAEYSPAPKGDVATLDEPGASEAPFRGAASNEVSARVLLLVAKDGVDHCLMAGARARTGANSKYAMYGGPVPDGPDDEVLAAVHDLVARQTGLDSSHAEWTKFCTMEYDERPKTVYYLARVAAGAVVKPSATREEEVYVENVVKKEEVEQEVEVEEEAEAEEPGGEPVLRKVKKIVKKVVHQIVPEERTRHVPEIHLRPHLVPLGVLDGTTGSAEARLALHILGDLALRQATLDVLSFLRSKSGDEAKVAAVMKAQKAATVENRKTTEECKAAIEAQYKEQLAAKESEWEEEDRGEMDDDIAAQAPARAAVRKALRTTADEDYKAQVEALQAEWDKTLRVEALKRNERVHRAFTLLSVAPNGTYATLANAVMAAYPEKAAWECEALLGKILTRRQGVLKVEQLCSVRCLSWKVPRDDGLSPYELAVDPTAAAGEEGGDVTMTE